MAGTTRIEPLERLKVADAIAAQLSRMISAGEYGSGERLPTERQLAEQFGVGRSSMREALRSLASEGLVRIEHGVGVFVGEPSARKHGRSGLLVVGDYTVPELFEVRLPLERQAASLAAERISADEIAHLREVLAEAADPVTPDDRFIELDAELHRAIAGASKNPLLISVVASMEAHFFTYSHQVIDLHDRRSRAQQGHEAIVDALAAGDAAAARKAAVAHIREVEADIVAHLAGRV